MSLLELRAAGYAYGSRRVLDDVSLSLDDGDSLMQECRRVKMVE